MPVIRLHARRLSQILGREIPSEQLGRLLMRLKAEVEEVGREYISIEVNSDRLDMMTSEGVARALKGLLGIEVGLPKYSYRGGGYELEVLEVPSRPYIAMAVIRGVRSSEEYIEELIQFQEKLHTTIGRRRRKVAIGIHDLSKIPSNKCIYRELEPGERLVPLGYARSMSVAEMLSSTEQGRLYGSISLRDGRLPGIVCGDTIISVPPVINSNITRVTQDTEDLLIDVTGTDLDSVLKTLEILSTTLAEGSRYREIGRVLVKAPWGYMETPRGESRIMRIDASWASKILGLDMDGSYIAKMLLAMRIDARALGSEVEAAIPPYRIDIIDPVDLVEEVAIAIDLNSIDPEPLVSTLPGRPSRESIVRRRVRDIMIGLGFTEIYRHVLVPSKTLADLGYTDFLRIKNPVSSEMDAARPSMIPSILEALRHSQHSPKPVKVFEIGEIVVRDPSTYTGWETRLAMAAAILDHEISFEDIQAPLFSLLRSLGLEPKTAPTRNTIFIDGRAARIMVNNTHLGYIGEASIETLKSLEIQFPIALFEIDLTKLLEIMGKPINIEETDPKSR